MSSSGNEDEETVLFSFSDNHIQKPQIDSIRNLNLSAHII